MRTRRATALYSQTADWPLQQASTLLQPAPRLCTYRAGSAPGQHAARLLAAMQESRPSADCCRACMQRRLARSCKQLHKPQKHQLTKHGVITTRQAVNGRLSKSRSKVHRRPDTGLSRTRRHWSSAHTRTPMRWCRQVLTRAHQCSERCYDREQLFPVSSSSRPFPAPGLDCERHQRGIVRL